MVDPNHTRLSIVRQCRLVSIARSSFYYEGTGENPLTLRLMRLIDALVHGSGFRVTLTWSPRFRSLDEQFQAEPGQVRQADSQDRWLRR